MGPSPKGCKESDTPELTWCSTVCFLVTSTDVCWLVYLHGCMVGISLFDRGDSLPFNIIFFSYNVITPHPVETHLYKIGH